MRWIRDILLGIFTKHLGTKLLALLLSLGLFGFVQASITASREIRLLTLHFNLVGDVREKYVLLTEELVFRGLTITGETAKVDPLARLYRGNPVVNLAIDQRFLNVYGENVQGEDDQGGKRIRIDHDLFADDALFGKDVTVGRLPDGISVVADRIATRPARVEAASDVATAITAPGHQYEGKITLEFNVKTITIEGPASAFTGEPLVLASVRDIVNELDKVQIRGERGEARLSSVQVRWNGIAAERLPLLRIAATELGGGWMSAAEFQQRLIATCPVTKRKVPKTLNAVPIQIRYATPRPFDLVEHYEAFSPFLDSDLKVGQAQRLDVRLPVSLAGKDAFLKNLVVVLDVAAAASDDAGILFVPFYLDLNDRSRDAEDVTGLALVEIATTTGESDPPGRAQFRKR